MLYGITDPSQQTTRFVQSAQPEELAERVNALLASLAAAGTETVVGMTLSGAGDGHTFVVAVTSAPTANVVGGYPPGVLTAVAYSASDARALEAVASTLTFGLNTLADAQVAGASSGTRFMGLFLTSSEPTTAAARGLVAGDSLALAIAGTTPLVDANGTGIVLQPGGGFFDSPGPGRLRYIGTTPVQVSLWGNLGVARDTTFDAQLDIVTDPTGAPVAQTVESQIVGAAGLTQHVSVVGFATLVENTELALRLSFSANTATVASAQLMAVAQNAG